MNCPICQSVTLAPSALLNGLVAQRCPQCQGNWLNSYELWGWMERQPKAETATTHPPEFLPQTEAKPGAKLCPECGHFLSKYRVGIGSGFALDRCGNCGGVWLDGKEWEILQQHGLQTQFGRIFSAEWQRSILQAEKRQNLEKLYQERVGASDFAEIKRIKEWLQKHPRGADMLRYLADEEL
jgi:Zn-finger nucleic acid-binding protein